MKTSKKIIAFLLSLVMALTAFPTFPQAAEEGSVKKAQQGEASGEYEAGQVIIVTKEGTGKSQMREMAKEVDGELDTVSAMGDGTKIGLVQVDEGDEQKAIASLSSEDKILIAQPNYKYELAEYPDDPYYQKGKMEYLSADPLTDEDNAGSINAAGAWQQLGNSKLPYEKRVLVGVIDTGARLDHVDLQDVVVRDKCITYNKGKKMGFRDGDGSDDDIGHGTSVTGIIAANINNTIGGCGVAGGRARVMVVDAGDVDGGINTIDLAMGIYYETDQGARIINMSVGGSKKDMVTERAVKYAWDNNVLVVCAAGNKGSSFIFSPSDAPYSLSVMSHDKRGNPSTFSCFGINKDISAPGEHLVTPGYLRRTSYEFFDGTSASCPIVAGAAALLLSEEPGLTPRELKNLLFTSSGKESFSADKSGQGFGMINLDTAMKNLRSEKTSPEKVILNRKSIDMYEGQDTHIEYAVYPGNTNSANASFRSSNENVVTVDKDGVIKANKPGKATITVSCKGASTICTVNVKEIPYVTVDRKPYYTTGKFTMDEPMESFSETSDAGAIIKENGFYYHLYHIDLEKGETIKAIMKDQLVESFICIKDMDGNIVAKDDLSKSILQSQVTFTADQTGTYQLMAVQINGVGEKTETDYKLKIASDRAYCEPKISSTDYGQMRMTWPAVGDADCYLIRKYSDRELTDVESETIVDGRKYTDTEYDSGKDQYYTVTACLQTIEGLFYCGESPLVVKKNDQAGDKGSEAKKKNPLRVKGRAIKIEAKKLKKNKVVLKPSRVMKVRNARGKVTYTKLKGNKKILIDKKTGRVTIRKKLKRGTYKIKVKVKAAGNQNYKAAARKLFFIVKVR